MIDQATVDKILDSANILEVVSDFVTLRKRGVNYVGLCPFHDEKTPSFSVSPSKGICKCFSCGKGGSPVHFIMEHEQLSYYEALRYLAKKYNIEIQERELTDEEKRAQGKRESMLIVNAFAQEYFSKTLFNHPDGHAIGLSYFYERGFRDDIIRKFGLGYSLDRRDALYQEAVKRGYKKEYLLDTGLCIESSDGRVNDRFRGRVIFPVYSLSGKIVAFGGRILKKDDKMAKYVNSPESEIYHKSNELYGIYHAKQAIVKQDTCYLVEGYTDVLSMHQSGIENVVASSGTSLTPGQIRLIHRFTDNVTILYDGDAAGIKASLRGIDLLLKEGIHIKVVLLPDGDDPDSFSKKQSAASFTQYIKEHEVDFIRFKTNLLLEGAGKDPIKKASLISDIVKSIAAIPDNIERSVYTKECSRLMEIDESVLLREINKIRYDELRNKKEEEQRARTAAVAQPAVNETTAAAEPQTEALPQTETPPPAPMPATRTTYANDMAERTLIRYIIRYGEKELFPKDEPTGDEAEKPMWKVAPYIFEDLRNDEITLSNPLYQRIIEEAEMVFRENKNLSRYFIEHVNREISETALNCISDKYELSKVHTKFQHVASEEERLTELVPRALYELKSNIINQNIKEIQSRIKAGKKDSAETQRLMSELTDLYKLKAALAKELGERTVNPA